MKRYTPYAIIALHVFTCTRLHGQTPPLEPVALTNSRAAFLRQVVSDSQLLTEQYERALTKAESEIANSGDYEEARAIRLRREQLKALYSGTASSLATPLPLAQSRLIGSAQSSGESLTGWRSHGSGAEWLNFRLIPGRYYFEIEANMSDAPVAGSIYASSKFQPQQTASFEFNEVTLLGDASENRRSFEISRSTDETTFTTVRVGPLNFTRNPITLRFACAAGYPANIIRIRNMRLVPVTEENVQTPAAAPISNATTALQQATTALKTSLESARKSAEELYLDELHNLAVTKPELKEQVEAETRRLKRLGDSKNGPTGIRAITSGTGNLNGFEDINEARLADEEPASGERFTVLHEGRKISIRLLWIDCAPTTENDPGVKRFAKHFSIEDEEALSIGRTARDFTAAYLSGKPLRLLVRPDRDKDGTFAALLFLPEVGMYQNVLVDQGLTAVIPPPNDDRRNATEKALITSLQDREIAAKSRSKPLGAWALTPDALGGKKP